MKVQIRTKKKEGKTPLYMRIKIGEEATWVNLMLSIDIEKWNAAANSEKKISNLLDKLGYTRKIQEIEFAIKDLRRKHKLSKEAVDSAIDSIALAEQRTVLAKQETLKEKYVEIYEHSFRKLLIDYVDSAVAGTRRHSYGSSFAHFSTNILRQVLGNTIVRCIENPPVQEDYVRLS